MYINFFFLEIELCQEKALYWCWIHNIRRNIRTWRKKWTSRYNGTDNCTMSNDTQILAFWKNAKSRQCMATQAFLSGFNYSIPAIAIHRFCMYASMEEIQKQYNSEQFSSCLRFKSNPHTRCSHNLPNNWRQHLVCTCWYNFNRNSKLSRFKQIDFSYIFRKF